MTETGFYSLSSADIALLTTVRCTAQAKSSSLPNTALILPNRAVGSLPEWSYKRSHIREVQIFVRYKFFLRVYIRLEFSMRASANLYRKVVILNVALVGTYYLHTS